MPDRRGLEAVYLTLFLVLTGLSLAVNPAGTATASAAAGGRSLEQALEALQTAGLKLVFSNTLVRPDYRVAAEPDPHAPLSAQAAALLEPFGLSLERAGPDLWYVVRTRPPPAPQPAAPEPAAPAPRPDQGPILEEVVVSSPRYRLERNTHDRQQLDARDLEDVPSTGRDLLRAVNQLPGQASLGVSARSHMRGGDSNEVLYLVDGVQVIQPFHMEDFHALFSSINPALVDAVNVYHAGFPADFGTRLSGVVDMELTEPDRPLEGKLDASFIDAAGLVEGASGNSRWLVSARRSTLEYLLDHVAQNYGRPRFSDGLARFAWDGENADLVVGALYSSDELVLEDPGGGETATADYDDFTGWARVTRSLGQRLDLELAGSYTAIDNQRQGRLDAPADAIGSLQEQRSFSVAAYRSALRWRPSERWLLHVGVEGQRQSGDFQVSMASRYGILGRPLQPSDTLMRDFTADRAGTLLGAFVSAQQKLTDAVTVEYGWRCDLQDLDPVHDRQTSPRVQVTYDGGGAWRAFLNVGRYAQHQNLYELQLDDGLVELSAPQLSDQVSAGAQWQIDPSWRVRVEGYWRSIDDPWPRFENLYNAWVLLPELHADRVNVVPERARTYGGEGMLEYRPDDALTVSLSVGLARAEERLDGHWQPRPWEQRRTLRGSLDWRPGNWRLGIAATFHSGWPTTTLISQPLTDTARLYDATLRDYFSLDVHVARHIPLPASALEIYFDLGNATSAENVGGYRYGLEDAALVREERRLLPAVPVLGMSWSW